MRWPAELGLVLGTARPEQFFSTVLPWLAVLVVVVVVGFVVIVVVRKQLTHSDAPSSGGFTLHDLRELHAAGELSDEEFERARAAMIGRVRAEAEPEADVESAPGDDDAAPDAASGKDADDDGVTR